MLRWPAEGQGDKMQIIPGDNRWAGIGAAFGKGLGEQIPKEVERRRLSGGLEDLEKAEGLSPTQTYAKLFAIPGMTPQIASTLGPLYERSFANKEAMKRAEQEGQGMPQGQQGIDRSSLVSGMGAEGAAPIVSERAMEEAPVKRPKLGTKEAQQATIQPVLPLTPMQSRVLGAELHKQYPYLYKTPQEGEAKILEEHNRKMQAQQALAERGKSEAVLRSTLEDEIKKRSGKALEINSETGLYRNIPGTFLSRMEDAADEKIASGEATVQEASQEAANKIKKYADARERNANLGNKWWFFGKTPENTRQTEKSIRNTYKEMGELRQYKMDLVEQHQMSEPGAAYLTWPIADNKGLNNHLSKFKPLPLSDFNAIIPGVQLDAAGKNSRKVADDLGKYLSDNDSLLSIGYELAGKGYNANAFLDEVRKNYEEGKIRLNERQVEELSSGADFRPSRGDWFMYEMGKIGRLPEIE